MPPCTTIDRNGSGRGKHRRNGRNNQEKFTDASEAWSQYNPAVESQDILPSFTCARNRSINVPSTNPDPPSLSFYRQRIEAAYQTGFALLARIPSTNVWRTLSYVDSLASEDRHALFDSCAELARAHVESAVGIQKRELAFDASVIAQQSQLHDRVASSQLWSRFPDAFLRQLASNEEWLASLVGAERLPSILACPIPEVAKAAKVRSVVHKHLKDVFNAKASNQGAGNWLLTGESEGRPVEIWFDYGGMGGGFRYGVNGLTLEATYGFAPTKVDWPLVSQLNEIAETLETVALQILDLQVLVTR